ncbi:MAG TPA: DUF2182 domain-containing protein [Paraburkholderia sp.]|uniref:DUF2182 domain-containing protein n=1 Tax=Paraburkholderia sp. TaxID=1926495 RepID=UPI002B8162EA|nr:DUF2182 domain-containing protein [Paraburkholderia sp.]HTR08576.1 DUF2182 domain-containing protein [Paraburkholderia sp.]
MATNAHASFVTPAVAAVSITAWLTLWGWDNSSYANYAAHTGWLDGALVDHLCSTLRELPGGVLIVLHMLSWLLMLIAMMLATTLPLLHFFRCLTRDRVDRNQLITLLVAGYLCAWMLFGTVAHGADALLHRLADNAPWLALHAWIPGATILAIAGAYQLSSSKLRCLNRCRSPMLFISERWHGTREMWSSFTLGWSHGLFCIGCCWALMLLMFAVGTTNIGWMLAIALVMGAEKNAYWGGRIRVPAAIGLLGWAAFICERNL